MEAQSTRKSFFDPKYKRQLPGDPIPGTSRTNAVFLKKFMTIQYVTEAKDGI